MEVCVLCLELAVEGVPADGLHHAVGFDVSQVWNCTYTAAVSAAEPTASEAGRPPRLTSVKWLPTQTLVSQGSSE